MSGKLFTSKPRSDHDLIGIKMMIPRHRASLSLQGKVRLNWLTAGQHDCLLILPASTTRVHGYTLIEEVTRSRHMPGRIRSELHGRRAVSWLAGGRSQSLSSVFLSRIESPHGWVRIFPLWSGWWGRVAGCLQFPLKAFPPYRVGLRSHVPSLKSDCNSQPVVIRNSLQFPPSSV